MATIDYPLNLEQAGPVWSWFDAELYARNDAKSARAARIGAMAALTDYLERGSALLFAPNRFFDPRFYVDRHADVAEGLRLGELTSAYDHYAARGWRDRDRDPHWLFSTDLYCKMHTDLTDSAVQPLGGHYGHYLLRGNAEGRIAHRFFDPRYYLANLSHDDREEAQQGPFASYLETAGSPGPERRTTPYFDPNWYVATYPEAAAALAAEDSPCALHYYLVHGSRTGHDPICDFSQSDYFALYPDVAEAVHHKQFSNGFHHFIEHGVTDPRSPSRTIDLAFYNDLHRVRRDMGTGRFANVFEHLLLVGLEAGLPLQPPVPPNFAPEEADTRKAFIAQASRALPDYGRHPLDFTRPPATAADVGVIMVLRNQFALTMQTLASLRSTFPGTVELVIVDNASSDGTTTIEDVVHGATILRNDTNVGFLRACNQALGHVTAPAVLYLNNDVVLHPGAVARALARLWSDPAIGAVGGKIVRTHGLLQEAGCILWRDAAAEGWLRDAPPDAPEANYVRDVDFCSGCFLLVRQDLLNRLGGFDDAFAPAYYEEADLCLRIQREGFRVVYDPSVSLTHLEYASSRSVRAATSLMVVNRGVLRRHHAEALRRRPVDRRARAEAAGFASRGRRILFIEDTVPLHRLGSGYGRAADVLGGLVAMGWQATVFPMIPVATPAYRITATLPDTVEVLWDRDRRSLKDLLTERRGFYDLIWVSRAHNLRQLIDILGASSDGLGHARVVLDTEAVFSVRDRALAHLNDLPFDMTRALGRELDNSWLCDHIVAVNRYEADLISGHTGRPVGIVGFRQALRVQPEGHAARRGLLHVGALTAEASPNVDALRWYLNHVQPILELMLGTDDARLTVVGHTTDGVDLTWLADHPNVDLLGPVTDLAPLYARHRVFVAPTRYGAGIPVKVLEATSYGLPVACTDLLRNQLGWENKVSIMSASGTDPDAFAHAVATLYDDAGLWQHIRDGAIARLSEDASPKRFASQLEVAVVAAGATRPGTGPDTPAAARIADRDPALDASVVSRPAVPQKVGLGAAPVKIKARTALNGAAAHGAPPVRLPQAADGPAPDRAAVPRDSRPPSKPAPLPRRTAKAPS